MTCVLTITSKTGSKTRFQSDFYTLLIICVPPIILGQVLRYFPTVVAIHMNSYVTSYDAFADEAKAIDLALDFISTCDANNKFIIFSDSLSVLKAMNHTSSKNP